MANKRVGSIDGTELSQFKLSKIRGTDGLWQLRYEYWAAEDQAESLVPAHNAACTETGHESLKCRNVSIEPLGDDQPNMARVIVEFMHPESSASLQAKTAGDTIKEVSSSANRVSLADERLGLSEGIISDLTSKGYTSAILPMIEYSYSEYVNTFTWSEANIISNIGTRDAPDGVDSPTANKWLQTGRDVRQVGEELIEKRRTWSYDKLGWETTLYS